MFFRLSLKNILGSVAGLTSRPLKFTLDKDLFSDQRHVRLLGLSVVTSNASDSSNEIPYQLKLSPPAHAWIFYSGGSAAVPIDQSFLPSVWVGRATSRSSFREPDVIGQVLKNASPLGEWTIELDYQSKVLAHTENLQDVEIQFHLKIQT